MRLFYNIVIIIISRGQLSPDSYTEKDKEMFFSIKWWTGSQIQWSNFFSGILWNTGRNWLLLE